MSTSQPPSTKPTAERIKESMAILKQLQDLGIHITDPSYKELSGRFNDWIKGGEAWVGNVDFYICRKSNE